MPTIALRFPGRRYHATPWGHHVNEGLVEWPPSPWRLLRALLATGHSKLEWREIPPLGISLLEKLASVLPRFSLPPASSAHSRHYMPAPVKTTLVFDTWAQIDEGELRVDWPIELTPDERDLLAALAARLSYVGRSESWVDARMVPESVTDPSSYPCEGSANPGPGWEQVSLLALEPAPVYQAWRSAHVAKALAEVEPVKPSTRKPSPKALKKAEEDRARLVAPFPKDLTTCLGIDTTWLQEHGWSQPPGSRRVLYWRRADALEIGVAPRARRTLVADSVEAMLFAIATSSRRQGALPSVIRTFPQALLIHRALASQAHGPLPEGARLALLGRARDGKPAQTHHGHAHVLPLDLDGDQKLDHVLVWAPRGLDADSQRVLRSLRKTYAKGVGESLQLTMVAEGSLAVIGRIGHPKLAAGMARVIGGAEARTWVSATPFLPVRYVKRRGKNTIEGQIRAELAERGLTSCKQVEFLDAQAVVKAKFLHFIRRNRQHQPKADIPIAVRLHFDEPVRTPLCLGFGSHYGLGRFEVSS